MGGFLARVSAVVMTVAVSLVFVGAPTADAARESHAPKFIGSYQVYIWNGTKWFSDSTMRLEANGHGGWFGPIHWSNTKNEFSLHSVSYDIWQGTKTPKGISTRKNPGHEVKSGEVVHDWYAIKIS